MERVEAPSAEISVVGSKRHRNEGWSPGSITRPSETNSRSNLPRSASRAISWMTARSLLLLAAPSYRHPAERLPVPRTNTPRCIARRAAAMTRPYHSGRARNARLGALAAGDRRAENPGHVRAVLARRARSAHALGFTRAADTGGCR